ncbi:MAG: fumarylacetoacetate hydrolase family protein [Paenibacillaceae bacterium]|nr:fumarylacetoacetate hydrolase family protein [Paenibacillaceae bacterium]
MRIIRFTQGDRAVLAAVADSGAVHVLPQADLLALVEEARQAGVSPLAYARQEAERSAPLGETMETLPLLVPVVAPEVWAAGVTYERSRDARNYEATGGKLDATTFYDKVYDAVRPEIFFKSTAARTVGPGQPVSLRSDSEWQIPEPELGLVLDEQGAIVGYTIGNDMSCRDIEGENPLYLPQAKMWRGSCAIGPAVLLADAVSDPYALQITCRIYRGGEKVVEGTASTGQLKRKLEELVSFLRRDNVIFAGTVLLTGTCIVPPNEFTLASGDRVDIDISGIGTLSNPVA